VTQLATPLVHLFLPSFLQQFCSSLHYLSPKMGWHTSMSHPHLFSCCMRDILQWSSKGQPWTLGSLNLFSLLLCTILLVLPKPLKKKFMLSAQCPSYVFKPSISSPVTTVLSSCNWISGKQKIDFQLLFPSPSTIFMYAYYSILHLQGCTSRMEPCFLPTTSPCGNK
jgi:hypothetical protein